MKGGTGGEAPNDMWYGARQPRTTIGQKQNAGVLRTTTVPRCLGYPAGFNSLKRPKSLWPGSLLYKPVFPRSREYPPQDLAIGLGLREVPAPSGRYTTCLSEQPGRGAVGATREKQAGQQEGGTSAFAAHAARPSCTA